MKRQIKRIISGLTVLALSLTLICPVAYATTIDEAQEKADELERQKDQAEEEQQAANDDLNAVIKDMEQLSKDLNAKQSEIEAEEEKLAAAKVKENDQYTSMKMRIKFMYEDGQSHFIEVLVNSEDIGDFLNKAEYVSTMSTYDREMLDEFQNTVKEIEKVEKKLHDEYNDLSVLQDEMFQKQSELEQILADKEIEISELDAQISENETLLQDLIAKAEEEKRKQEEQQQSNNNGGGGYSDPTYPNVSGSGTFVHPCPGAPITSGFGYRDFDGAFHKGTDFGAPYGAPTYAADAGTVVIAGWSNSAGNWVVINHGNGLVTKYMHHSALCVSAGQYVERGQQIGYVGNTGNSFGAHLHFQVELNGVAVDPLGYL